MRAADSLYFLGLLKLYGISVSPDAVKALECIRKAAELRHLEAMAALGVMLLHGRGETTAHRWDKRNQHELLVALLLPQQIATHT